MYKRHIPNYEKNLIRGPIVATGNEWVRLLLTALLLKV